MTAPFAGGQEVQIDRTFRDFYFTKIYESSWFCTTKICSWCTEAHWRVCKNIILIPDKLRFSWVSMVEENSVSANVNTRLEHQLGWSLSQGFLLNLPSASELPISKDSRTWALAFLSCHLSQFSTFKCEKYPRIQLGLLDRSWIAGYRSSCIGYWPFGHSLEAQSFDCLCSWTCRALAGLSEGWKNQV